MREIRTSGSEGGAAQSNASSLPLSLMASISTGFLLDKARDKARDEEAQFRKGERGRRSWLRGTYLP